MLTSKYSPPNSYLAYFQSEQREISRGPSKTVRTSRTPALIYGSNSISISTPSIANNRRGLTGTTAPATPARSGKSSAPRGPLSEEGQQVGRESEVKRNRRATGVGILKLGPSKSAGLAERYQRNPKSGGPPSILVTMPARLNTPVLTVDAAKMHEVDTRNAESLHGMWLGEYPLSAPFIRPERI
jgi:hypothetical protein